MKEAIRLNKLAISSIRHVVYRHWMSFRKMLRISIFPNLFDPVLYLTAMGLGLGHFVGRVDGMPYLQFITLGLIAGTAGVAYSASFTVAGYSVRLSRPDVYTACPNARLFELLHDAAGGTDVYVLEHFLSNQWDCPVVAERHPVITPDPRSCVDSRVSRRSMDGDDGALYLVAGGAGCDCGDTDSVGGKETRLLNDSAWEKRSSKRTQSN